MKKLSIEKQEFLNRNILCFNLNQRISYELLNSITHTTIEDEPLTPDQKSLLLKILEIDGVTEVGIDQYDITVEKAPMFDWKKIETAVLSLISNNFPKDVSEHIELIKKYNKESFQSFKEENSKN